jgi:ActR/RegA family two-component response regulator
MTEKAVEEAEKWRPDYAIVDVHRANGSLGTKFGVRLRRLQNMKFMLLFGNDDTATLWRRKVML